MVVVDVDVVCSLFMELLGIFNGPIGGNGRKSGVGKVGLLGGILWDYLGSDCD